MLKRALRLCGVWRRGVRNKTVRACANVPHLKIERWDIRSANHRSFDCANGDDTAIGFAQDDTLFFVQPNLFFVQPYCPDKN